LKKKKKKKKTSFDIDAALAEGTMPDSSENSDLMSTDKENQEPPRGDNEAKEMELDGKLMSRAVPREWQKVRWMAEVTHLSLRHSCKLFYWPVIYGSKCDA
jgi:hypothetical protein